MGQRPSRPTPPSEDAPSTAPATPSPAPAPRQRVTTRTTKRGSKDKEKRASILGLPTLGSIRKRKPTISRASSATASTSASGSGVRLRDNAGTGGRSWRRWSRAGRKSVVDVDVEEDVEREDVVEEGEEDGEGARSSTPVVVPTSPAQPEESRAAAEPSGGNVEGSGERRTEEGQQTLGGPLPPAGTLVVVQGVVHTTDVSASLPAPPPPPPPAPTPTSPTSPPTDAGNVPGERERQREDIPRGVPTLSPTSIDVLGTLLSVATAATAASLVTGSSAPLFSSGLEPATSTASSSSPSSTSTSASPANGSSSAATSAESTPQPPSRPPLSPEHERMRSAWGSIRDRFGLGRPTSPSSSSSPSSPSSPSIPSAQQQQGGIVPAEGGSSEGTAGAGDEDARTQLLAEMARAFHLGMGLDEPAGANPRSPPAHPNPTTTSSSSPTSPASPSTAPPTSNAAEQEPAEGSFERFLLDLQSDLRRTLGGPQAAEGGSAAANGSGVNGGRVPTPPPARHIPGPSAESEDEVNSRRAAASSSRPSTSGQTQDRIREGQGEEVDQDVLDFVGVDHERSERERERERADTPHPGATRMVVPDVASSDGHGLERSEELDTRGPGHSNTTSEDAQMNFTDGEEGIRFADDGPIRPHIDLGRAHDQPRSRTPVSRTGTPHVDHAHPHVHPHTHGPSPLGAGAGGTGGTRVGGGEQPRGINWWRMYRFPPMRVPATGPSAATGGVSATPPSTAGGVPDSAGVAGVRSEDEERVGAAEMGFDTTPRPNAEDGDGDGDGDEPPPLVDIDAESTPRPRDRVPTPYPSSNPSPPTDPGPEQDEHEHDQSSIVVPVIVVGLQSVHGHRPPPPPSPTTGPGRTPTPTSRRASSIWPTTPAAGGEEGWRSRAADAFRGLRRPRGNEASSSSAEGESRDEGAGTNAGENREEPSANGSTTFFIYVIGGYYPPTHPLVTGAPNAALDSFEALWELADLLGPAKPPTATREDIAKAGLRIVKPDEMRSMEAEGKVVEACVERCLICLEDYDDADDLRLLGCRHIFHKSCVDTWLETGRNNCPACRAQGVQRAVDEPVAAAA